MVWAKVRDYLLFEKVAYKIIMPIKDFKNVRKKQKKNNKVEIL